MTDPKDNPAAGLIERYYGWRKHSSNPCPTSSEFIAALEALAKEKAELEADLDAVNRANFDIAAQATTQHMRAEKAEAERDALQARVDELRGSMRLAGRYISAAIEETRSK